jgi:acid phosphatase type 7
MIQPNVYWTLTTPFATIVGLYTNVPEHGYVGDDQKKWFAGEIAAAAKDRALIVATHHPIYSADAFHGSSPNIGDVLNAGFEEAGRTADLVLTGHVHNYQRLTETRGAESLTYVVAGAGGYYHLHYIGHDETGHPPPPNWEDKELGVVLNTYNQTDHGYLRLTVSQTAIEGEYMAVSRPQTPGGPPASTTITDQFQIPI